MIDRMSNGQSLVDEASPANKRRSHSQSEENVKASLNNMKAQVARFVARKPGTAIVVGLLAGAALGWLVSRKK